MMVLLEGTIGSGELNGWLQSFVPVGGVGALLFWLITRAWPEQMDLERAQRREQSDRFLAALREEREDRVRSESIFVAKLETIQKTLQDISTAFLRELSHREPPKRE